MNLYAYHLTQLQSLELQSALCCDCAFASNSFGSRHICAKFLSVATYYIQIHSDVNAPWYVQVQTVSAQPSQYQAPPMRTGGVTSLGRSANGIGSFDYGRVHNKGIEGYGAGRVRNIPGGYSRKTPSSFGNYSWGHGNLM